MTFPPSEPFDHPPLKRAIRDLVGEHRADTRLRAKVAEAMAAEKTMSISAAPRRSVFRWAAAAATVAIALTAVGYGLKVYRVHAAERAEIRRLDAAEHQLLGGMLAAHQRRTTGDEKMAAPLADPAALAAEASQRLGRPVPQPKLTSAGWTLDDAAYCTIGGKPSARFHFTKGVNSVTLVSLPTSAWDGLPGSMDYTVKEAGSAIVGYALDGSLNCIVADAAVSSADAEKLRNTIRYQ